MIETIPDTVEENRLEMKISYLEQDISYLEEDILPKAIARLSEARLKLKSLSNTERLAWERIKIDSEISYYVSLYRARRNGAQDRIDKFEYDLKTLVKQIAQLKAQMLDVQVAIAALRCSRR